jgi:hypothetical protein
VGPRLFLVLILLVDSSVETAGHEGGNLAILVFPEFEEDVETVDPFLSI